MKAATLGFVLFAGTATAVFAQGPIAEFMNEWDVDASGAVTIEDFHARRGDQFYMFDLNEDGSIDAEEQANMDATVASAMDANHGGGNGNGGGHGAGGPGAKIHATMTAEYADTNGDGAISADEWTAATERLFAELDTSGDGELSPADFGH